MAEFKEILGQFIGNVENVLLAPASATITGCACSHASYCFLEVSLLGVVGLCCSEIIMAFWCYACYRPTLDVTKH